MTYDIAGKTILITGANRGIGKVLLESFLERGAAKVYAAVMCMASSVWLRRLAPCSKPMVEVSLHSLILLFR